jgi:hypothetical protein
MHSPRQRLAAAPSAPMLFSESRGGEILSRQTGQTVLRLDLASLTTTEASRMMQACLRALEDEFARPSLAAAHPAQHPAAQPPRATDCPARQFLAECCTLTGRMADRITGPQFRAAFQLWQLRSGQDIWTERRISVAMRALCARTPSSRNGGAPRVTKSSVIQYAGLQFKPDFHGTLPGAARAA